MKVTAVKTAKVRPGDDLFGLIDAAISELIEASIVVVTSKIISLAEGGVVRFDKAERQDLIEREADLYLPRETSRYNHMFTIKNNTLIASAGIDESNGGDNYVLWPRDAFSSANAIRRHLAEKFMLEKLGVIVTDSTSSLLRRGTTGIALAWSGFAALNNYIGKPDLFGRPFKVSQSSIAGGLAAAAVVVMGEGSEQTPLAILEDLPFVNFQDRDPSHAEIAEINISLADDLFAPFLEAVPWQKTQASSEIPHN